MKSASGQQVVQINGPAERHQERGEVVRPLKRRRWIPALVGLGFLVVAAIYAYATIFSHFAPYDDEGYLMVSVRGILEGHPLYKEVLTGYGPVYYFYEWFLHGPLGLALNHDVTRILCIAHWLGASSILGLAIFRVTRSVPMALFTFIQAAAHLTQVAREPGHPQEIVAVLLALAALVATRGLEQKWTLPILTIIGAAAVFTKINVGIFYGLSLLTALMCQATLFRSYRWWFWVLLVASSLLPFVLMRPQLPLTWARVYAGQVCISVLTAGAVGYCLHGKTRIGFAKLLQAGALFVLVSSIFIAVCLITGSSLWSLLESLVTGPARISSVLLLPLRAPHCTWSGAAALVCAIAVIAGQSRLDSARFAIAAAKALYGLTGSLLLVTDSWAQLGYLLPWTWLLLVPVAPNPSGDREQIFTRTFLALAVAWQGLQAYPFAGTQAVIATLLPILAYSLCLFDAIKVFASAPQIAAGLRELTPRVAGLMEVLVFVGLLYLFAAKWCNPFLAWENYASAPKLNLPGASLLHLPQRQAQGYQALTQYLESQSDTFITVPGQNSLYFWTGKTPPTYFNISEVILLNDKQQSEVVSQLRKARRPLIVLNKGFWYFSTGAGPLGSFIERNCQEIKTIGEFHILELAKESGRRAPVLGRSN